MQRNLVQPTAGSEPVAYLPHGNSAVRLLALTQRNEIKKMCPGAA